MIEFISHESFPDDNYTKELVYLQIDGKRFGYIAKASKNGAIFWDEISVSVNLNGEKKYYKAFKFDSQFLRDDILAFLKARSWENKAAIKKPVTPLVNHSPTPPVSNYQQPSFLDECPF